MKRLLLIAALLFFPVFPVLAQTGCDKSSICPAAGGSPAAFVQANSCSAAATSCNFNLTGVVAGHGFVGFIGNNNIGAGAITITNGTDTFTAVKVSQAGTGTKSEGWYVLSTATSGTVTFTCNIAVGTITGCVVFELSNLTGIETGPLSNTAAASTTWSCPTTYTTAHANALVICAGETGGAIASISGFAGFTIPTNGSVITNVGTAMQYKTGVASGQNLQPTFTSGTSASATTLIFAFF